MPKSVLNEIVRDAYNEGKRQDEVKKIREGAMKMCRDQHCPYKYKCRRHPASGTVPLKPGLQPWLATSPFDTITRACHMLWLRPDA